MKNVLIITSFLIFSFYKSQENIQTDRPDQTESTSITPANYFQIETGFHYEKTSDNSSNFALPTILWKYGVIEHFELRLETNFISEKIDHETTSGFPPVTFGFKTRLVDEKKWIPAISFLGHLTTNKWGSKEFQTTHLSPSFRFLFNHTLTDKFSIGYNFGAEWNGESPDTTGLYTFATALSVTEKLGAFAEIYGYVNKYKSADHRIDGGFTYHLNHNFQLDASAGLGLSEISPDYLISCGFSYRFNTK